MTKHIRISSILLFICIFLALCLIACSDQQTSENKLQSDLIGSWLLVDAWEYLWVVPAMEQIAIDPSSQITGKASISGKYEFDFNYAYRFKPFLGEGEIVLSLTVEPIWANLSPDLGLVLVDSFGQQSCEFNYLDNQDSVISDGRYINDNINFEYDQLTGYLSLPNTNLWSQGGSDSVIVDINCFTPLFHLLPGETTMVWPRPAQESVSRIFQITFNQDNLVEIFYDSTFDDSSAAGIWNVNNDTIILNIIDVDNRYTYRVNSDTLDLFLLPDSLDSHSIRVIEEMGYIDSESLDKAWWITKSTYFNQN